MMTTLRLGKMRKVLSAMIVVAAILGSSCSNTDPSTDFARYRVSVEAPSSQIDFKPGENTPESGLVNGALEIAVSDESACLTLTGLQFTEASLLKEKEIVARFLVSESQGGDICTEVPSENLRTVLEDPDTHRLTIELDNGTIIDSDLVI